jgi:ATP-dependent Clp protease protease subunit
MISTCIYSKGAPILKKIEEFNADDRIDVGLLENNVHFLIGEINEINVNQCIKWIIYENLNKRESKVLTLYVNSPGGDLYQAFALVDIMRNSTHPIRTVGIGCIMSAAFLIFASGTKGERYIAANTGLMCHQYSDVSEGKHHDLKATMKEGENCNQRMMNILEEATNLTPAKVKSKLLNVSDVYLTAEEAIELNIADQLL